MAIDKLVDSAQLDADLTSVANAIRFKADISGELTFPTGFVTAIGSILPGVDVEALSVTQNGTYTAPSGKAYSPVTVNVSGGGGGEAAEPKDVNFIDYDGTVLHSYTTAEALALTELPTNPAHSGLISQGWNYTLAQIKTECNASGECTIGQMYVTDDGKTRLYCHFEDGRLHPHLGIGVNGTVSVDWGDRSQTDVLTGTSLTAVETIDHIYSEYGNYIISLTVESGTGFTIFGVANTSHILKKGTAITANINKVYTNCLKKVELGNNVSIGKYAFENCSSLQSITIPSGITSIGNNSFQYCNSLQSITIPNGITSIGTYAVQNCYSLQSITIPSGITSLGTYAFQNCYPLQSITIPSGITSIGQNLFSNCVSLTNIVIPSGITSIGNSAFNGCTGLGEIHFKSDTPPTIANSNAFNGLQSDCIIYVPAGSLETYTTAANYPSSSTYTYVEE